jgi:hypothetical protein
LLGRLLSAIRGDKYVAAAYRTPPRGAVTAPQLVAVAGTPPASIEER